jgi:hypothetical protein
MRGWETDHLCRQLVGCALNEYRTTPIKQKATALMAVPRVTAPKWTRQGDWCTVCRVDYCCELRPLNSRMGKLEAYISDLALHRQPWGTCFLYWNLNVSFIYIPTYLSVYLFLYLFIDWWGHVVAKLVQALCYKPEGREFDCGWDRWIFQLSKSLQPHYGPEVDSASNRNEYQKSSWG